MNLSGEFFRNADLHPDKPAIARISGEGVQAITYRELADEVMGAMGFLGANGIAGAPYVAYSVRDPVSDLINFMALTSLGVGIYEVTSANGVERDVVGRLGISMLVADHDDLGDLGLARISTGRMHSQAWATRAAPVALPDCTNRPWIVTSSSGTTGSPKIFVTSHIDGEFRRRRYFSAVASRHGGFYSFTPIRFVAARHRYFHELSRGASVYFLEESDALEKKVEKVNRHGIANIYCVPMYLELLSDQARRMSARGDSSMLFPHAPLLEATSSPVSPGLRKRVEESISPCLVNCYALSEVGHISSTLDLKEFDPDGSDVGRPLDGIDVGIFDEAGLPVRPGDVGQIAVRFTAYEGAVLYLDESGAWVSPMRGEWFFTGDLGRMAPGGKLIFMGRADDLIIFNGINVFPNEIERSALAMPGVRDACAFGVQSRIHYQVPCVAVIADPGFNERDFMRAMRKQLGSRAPASVTLLSDFPRNAMGKVLRNELREVVGSRPLSAAVASRGNPGVLAAGTDDQWSPCVHVAIDVSIPKSFDAPSYEMWAGVLTEHGSWSSAVSLYRAPDMEGVEKIFVDSFVSLSCVFFELGRVPVFPSQLVLSIAGVRAGPGGRRLDLDIPAIDFIPVAAYRLVITVARDICQWMALNPPTQKNMDIVFNAIEDKLIKPLRTLVPASKSTMPVLKAAKDLGIPFIHLGLGVYQLGWGSRGKRLDGSRTGLDSAIGSRLSQNKIATAGLLRMAGLPAPVHGVASNEQGAIALADRIGFPVVVKPVDMDRGEGVSVDIGDAKALSAAFAIAKNASKSQRVIVERQVSGVCHRLFVAGGRVLYTVKRLPISVRGDGVRSVRQIVADEVEVQARMPPWRRSGISPLDELAIKALGLAGLSPESILGDGVLAPLRRIESTEWGGVDEDMTSKVHPDNLSAAIEATRLMGLDVAGVDIISPDISRPWAENGAIINEVNFSPLLGGGEISRSHIGELLAELIEGDGKIPVERFDGERAAGDRREDYLSEGVRCFHIDPERTIDHAGRRIAMSIQGVEERIRALLLRPDVDAVVVCS